MIVAAQHRRYWFRSLRALPSNNVIVQPRNCGTANGILLCVLTILERDPLAHICFLPADHYVSDESAFAVSLREVTRLRTTNPDGLTFLGVPSEEPDPGFGYIVAGRHLADGARSVSCFIEKPELNLARQLCASGALWNTFIFATRAHFLLEMLRARLPGIVSQMETVIAHGGPLGTRAAALYDLYEDLYRVLPTVDFSHAFVRGAESVMRVLTAPACGWDDLGTPQRVARTLQRLERQCLRREATLGQIPSYGAPAMISLATQHARLGLAGQEMGVSG